MSDVFFSSNLGMFKGNLIEDSMSQHHAPFPLSLSLAAAAQHVCTEREVGPLFWAPMISSENWKVFKKLQSESGNRSEQNRTEQRPKSESC